MERSVKYGEIHAEKIEFKCPESIVNAIKLLHREIEQELTLRQVAEKEASCYQIEVELNVYKRTAYQSIRSTQINLFKHSIDGEE